jgi:serine/threonine protein kinase
LDYIHSRNVIHHDIKPSNIGRSDENQWTLFDFNIATQLKEEHGNLSHLQKVLGLRVGKLLK